LDLAPTEILLGDLKPGGSAEPNLGVAQINDYQEGINLTTTAVNDFIDKNPDKVDETAKKWIVKPDVIPHESLKIPDKLTYPTGNGIYPISNLSVYRGNERVTEYSRLTGALYVYDDKEKGIWSYEWLPDIMPTSMGSAAKNVNKVLKRLHAEVIPNLRMKRDLSLPKPHIKNPSETFANRVSKRASADRIQRQPAPGADVPFNLKNWDVKHYEPWKKDAEALVGGKDKSSEVPVAIALTEVSQRLGKQIKVPADIKQTGKDALKIEHWAKWGGLYGRLRETFGGLFVKVAGVHERIKKWFEQRRDNKDAKSFNFGSGPIAEAAKIAFGLVKQFLLVTTRKVGDILAPILKNGATALLKSYLIGGATDAFAENVEALKKKVDVIKVIEDGFDKNLEAKVGEFLKPVADAKRFFDEIKSGLSKVGDILKLVKWGIRIVQCASPPLLGCFKLALSVLTDEITKKIVSSCWFQGKAIRPLFNDIAFFKGLPQSISNSSLGLLRDIIPLPRPELEILLPEKAEVPESDIKEGELKCNESTPEDKALAEMFDKYGEEKVEQMMKLMEAKGVNEGAKLTVSDIGKIDKVLGKMSEEDLENAVNNPDAFKGSAFGRDLEELVKDMNHKKELESGPKEALGMVAAAEQAQVIAGKVKMAQKRGLYEEAGWQISWDPSKVKDNKVSGTYYTTYEGEDVAAFVQIQFITLDTEKVSGRIVSSTSLVNDKAEIKGSIDKTFFKGDLLGGNAVKK
jgi:hypothetical protein